jgi:hypothetical protein
MVKARQPEVMFIPRGIHPDLLRRCVEDLEKAGYSFSVSPEAGPGVPQKAGPMPIYSDRRILPRKCSRTGMRRDLCCCARCRALRRRKHRAPCRCWLCYADRMGGFIDRLGKQTTAEKWALFLTQSYRTRSFPWAKRFPMEQPQPSPDFVRHFVGRMIRWLEAELRECVEYFIAEQYGEIGGRLHQHIGLSSPVLVQLAEELAAMRRAHPRTTRLPETLKPFATMLWDKAGLNRILPWEEDAGYYIGRYIGRDARRCQWDFRVGPEPVRLLHPVGREVVAVSPAPDDSSDAYRQVLGKWHRC